jgi:hypothetical protein
VCVTNNKMSMPRAGQSILGLPAILLVLIPLCLATSSHTFNPLPSAATVPAACAVTKPADPAFIPPKPYASTPGPDSFWWGSEKLWTYLPADGTWSGLPHYTPDDPTYRQKLFFCRKGFNAQRERRPNLLLTGTRLDQPAPPLMSDRANAGWQDPNQPFIVIAINLPTSGCWQITAHYRSEDLTFVVWVNDPAL